VNCINFEMYDSGCLTNKDYFSYGVVISLFLVGLIVGITLTIVYLDYIESKKKFLEDKK